MSDVNEKICCKRFAESVAEGHILKAEKNDETAWFFKEWFHIYYCPFCGKSVKGEGFGTYDVDVKLEKAK